MSKREIKFRAWDGKQMLTMSMDYYSYPVFVDRLRNVHLEWDSYDLMQYTGLKDANGKEIYEGDILKGPLGAKMIVTWSDEEAAYFMRETGELGYSLDRRETSHHFIIGNIYENPELL